MSETAISRAILDAFEAMGVVAWRSNAGVIAKGGRYIHLAPKGTPDLLVLIPPHGHLLMLETKTATGKGSAVQLERHALLRKQGAHVRVVRSVDESLAAWREAVRDEAPVR